MLRALAVSVLVLSGLFWGAPVTWAVIETYEFSTVDREARYRRLSQELRCPKCQNQNIADSNAPISEDLRRLLYEQLESGASDDEILDDMVARYGEFVRYRPSADGIALWLWLAPGLMLAVGFAIVVVLVRRARGAGVVDLSEDERSRLSTFISDERGRRP
jgi:cytochrome c-type biogenesis protein CcmH